MTPQLIVPEDGANTRIDRWLAEHLTDHSRNEVQRWIKKGLVLLNSESTTAKQQLNPGDTVSYPSTQTIRPTPLQPEPLPLSILYEDSDLLVIDKEAGMVVHPSPGHENGTLVNAILYHVPDLTGVGGERRPGIVHRLDKDTSGVMVVAKHDLALRALQTQFKQRTVDKRYFALVEGQVRKDEGQIDAPIGRDPHNRKRQAILLSESVTTRSALTEYHVHARYHISLANAQNSGSFTLVEAHPITGRTHQIRVHFAWLGHPLVGDPIYGLKRQRLSVPRLCLHAHTLQFKLPSTNRVETFTAPLPPDFQQIVSHLENNST